MPVSDLSTPPGTSVPWLCRHAATHQFCEVMAQGWYRARELAAAELGVPKDELDPVMKDALAKRLAELALVGQ